MSEAAKARPAADFLAEWYDAASESHFWMAWRLEIVLRHLARLGLEPDARLAGFDIGCGHGAFARQLRSATAWSIDGCDVNDAALARQHHGDGRFFLYDIFEFRPDLKEKYDLVFLLDVIEHIEEPARFLTAARFYLREGGYIVINVPAIPSLFSRYDRLVGHLRRYTRDGLEQQVSAAGLVVETIAHWGLLLVPLAALRKAVSLFAPPDAAIRRGLVPPGPAVDRLLRLAMAAELGAARDVPFGASLLAIARSAAP